MKIFLRRSISNRRLVCEQLEPRTLTCASSVLFEASQLNISCAEGDDVIVLDRASLDGVHLTLNDHRSMYSGAEIRQIAIRGLESNDVVLIDPAITVPILFEAMGGDAAESGWLAAMQPTSDALHGIDYLVVTAEFLATGGVDLQSSSDMSETDADPTRLIDTSMMASHFVTHTPLGTPRAHWSNFAAADSHENLVNAVHDGPPQASVSHGEQRGFGRIQAYRVHKPG